MQNMASISIVQWKTLSLIYFWLRFGLTSSSCSMARSSGKLRGKQINIELIDGCGIQEGLGGSIRRSLLKKKTKTSTTKTQSKVISGSWLISKNLFTSIDFSTEVRQNNGELNPSWPALTVLRSSFAIVKTKDWSNFYVVPSNSIEESVGCQMKKRTLRNLKGAEEEESLKVTEKAATVMTYHRTILNHSIHNISNHRRLKDEPRGLALYPWEGTDINRNLNTICSLTELFSYVVVGTCDIAESDFARKQIAHNMKNVAVQYRVSKRGGTRGSVVVLTISNCLSQLKETGLGLLRLAQSYFLNPPVSISNNLNSQSPLDWVTHSDFILYLNSDKYLISTREVINSIALGMLANPCTAAVPSSALLSECKNLENFKGLGYQISKGNVCSGQKANSIPECIISPIPAPMPSQSPRSEPTTSSSLIPSLPPSVSSSSSSSSSLIPTLLPTQLIRLPTHLPSPSQMPSPTPHSKSSSPTRAPQGLIPPFEGEHLIYKSHETDWQLNQWILLTLTVCYSLIMFLWGAKYIRLCKGVWNSGGPLVYGKELFDNPQKKNRRRVGAPAPTFDTMYSVYPTKQQPPSDDQPAPTFDTMYSVDPTKQPPSDDQPVPTFDMMYSVDPTKQQPPSDDPPAPTFDMMYSVDPTKQQPPSDDPPAPTFDMMYSVDPTKQQPPSDDQPAPTFDTMYSVDPTKQPPSDDQPVPTFDMMYSVDPTKQQPPSDDPPAPTFDTMNSVDPTKQQPPSDDPPAPTFDTMYSVDPTKQQPPSDDQPAPTFDTMYSVNPTKQLPSDDQPVPTFDMMSSVDPTKQQPPSDDQPAPTFDMMK